MILQNFTRNEFGEDYGLMSHRLLTLLDLWRYRIGCPVNISSAMGALARHSGQNNQSEHNVDYWGHCLAADVFASDVWTRYETDRAVELAVECGFTGIGVYADTNNNQGVRQVMFHLGVRPTRNMGDPAVWGRVDHEYVSLVEAVAALPGER